MGFEPTEPGEGPAVFRTAAIIRSATSPLSQVGLDTDYRSPGPFRRQTPLSELKGVAEMTCQTVIRFLLRGLTGPRVSFHAAATRSS